jgi:hypothetical protein
VERRKSKEESRKKRKVPTRSRPRTPSRMAKSLMLLSIVDLVIMPVRCHTGGSMKLNARILHLAYMVYLLVRYIHD